jgi:crossover junction endodeoxyribonuclease RuvC
MIYIGVDPGLTGGVARINGSSAGSLDMPTFAYSTTGSVKRAVDLPALSLMLQLLPVQDDCKMFMERVNAFPGQGVSSMFSLGMSFWGVAGVAAALGIPVELVNPAAWKKHFGLGPDKDQARGLASRLYPGVDLSKKKDHGRAEALLIARYGMEKSK